jgi:hypothetical protein
MPNFVAEGEHLARACFRRLHPEEYALPSMGIRLPT